MKVLDKTVGKAGGMTCLAVSLLAVLLVSLTGCGPKVPVLSISSPDGHFMTFSGASQDTRPDWIFPLEQDTLLVNYMGQNGHAYGGGIPFSVVWTADECIGLGSLSPVPMEIAIPVEKKGNTVTISFDARSEQLPELFVYRGKGDCWKALQAYSKALQNRGIVPAGLQPSALETQWCGWGYGATFTPEEILGTLPKIKELGIEWVCVDDGFQTSRGGAADWRPSRFPEGTMMALADAIHAAGLKAMIWWYPMGMSAESSFVREHPEVVATDSLGSPWPLSHECEYVSPTHPLVLAEARAIVRMFLEEWDFDGIKLDGHQMNSAPKNFSCEDPMRDVRGVTDLYKAIYEEALAIKPEAVVQYCPCGDVFSVYHLPYLNQTVSSDPTSPWQVRSKAYVLKALAPDIPYYGDHVELIDDDFASQLAVGAVPGTKFTWPADNPDELANPWGGSSLLTPEREGIFRKAFGIYAAERQAEGTLLGGLYTLGFEEPEVYVVRKEGVWYYSLFAPAFDGAFTFRGLPHGRYQVEDLWNGGTLGTIGPKEKKLDLKFENWILLKVSKI